MFVVVLAANVKVSVAGLVRIVLVVAATKTSTLQETWFGYMTAAALILKAAFEVEVFTAAFEVVEVFFLGLATALSSIRERFFFAGNAVAVVSSTGWKPAFVGMVEVLVKVDEVVEKLVELNVEVEVKELVR